MQSSGRTFVQTLAASDTLHAVRCLGRIDVHLAGFGAGAAINALALITSHPVKRNLVKESVDRAQRTDILAERPSDDKACDDKDQKQYKKKKKKRP